MMGSPKKKKKEEHARGNNDNKTRNFKTPLQNSRRNDIVSKLSQKTLTQQKLLPTYSDMEDKINNLTNIVQKLIQNSSTVNDGAEPATVQKPQNNSQQTNTVKKKTIWTPMDVFHNNTAHRYYQIIFKDDLKRTINPFLLEKLIKENTGVQPQNISSLSRSTFLIDMGNYDDVDKMTSIDAVDDVPCKTSPYDLFNNSKGIIYVQDWDLSNASIFSDFKDYLHENYDIIDVSLAPFIKPRSEEMKAVLLTFSNNRPMYSVYIPGERRDCRVYPFHNKPMLCLNCHRYGHTKKKCKVEITRCKKCSLEGHSRTECPSERPNCSQCKGDHEVGSKDCPRHREEMELLEIQRTQCVSISRARQILKGISTISHAPTAPRIIKYDLCFSEENKRTFSPSSLERCLKNIINVRPKTIRTVNNTTYSVELNSLSQAVLLRSVEEVGG